MEVYKKLKAFGIRPYWPIHHGTTLSLYYRDPDGNRMEFQVDHGTVEEAIAFMASEKFAANPIGIAFDPDALLAKYEAGATEAELMMIPTGEPSPIHADHGLT